MPNLAKAGRRPAFRVKVGQTVNVVKRDKAGRLTDLRQTYVVREAGAKWVTLIGPDGEMIQIGH